MVVKNMPAKGTKAGTFDNQFCAYTSAKINEP